MISDQQSSLADQRVSAHHPLLAGSEMNIEDAIEFPFGLPGFESLTLYLVVEMEDYCPFKLLQSLEEPDVSMLILEASLLEIYDRIKIPRADLRKINIYDSEQPDIYVILKIDNKTQQFTANVKAPLVINTESQTGLQVILDDKSLPVNHKLTPP